MMRILDPSEPCWNGNDDEMWENQWDYEFDPRDED